jgi:hypothetical protein
MSGAAVSGSAAALARRVSVIVLVPFCNSIRSPAYQGLKRKNQVGMALQLSGIAAFSNGKPDSTPDQAGGMLFLKMP